MIFRILLPERAFTDLVLAGVTIPAEADCIPIIRLLPHARTGSDANVGNFNPGHFAAIRASMASDKVAVRL